MYKCPSCGAGLVFNPKTQELFCKSCRKTYDAENPDILKLDSAKEINNNNEVSNNVSDESNEEALYEAISYKCSHCGAELLTTSETITTFCSFCRNGTILDRQILKKRKPDYIIPFKITKEECEKIYVNKIKKAFFAPKNMIDTQEVKKIRPIYMPYWIYSYEKHGEVFSKGSKYSHRSGDYVYYDDYSLRTNVDAVVDGITHDATSNFDDRLSEAIAPFDIKDKKEFSPAYLSGYYADSEDIKDNVYIEEERVIANEHISSMLYKEKAYHKYGAKPNAVLNEAKVKLALFPVYFLATKNSRGDRLAYAVINGQNGKIAADVPIDFKKYGIFTAILAVILYFLLNTGIVLNMTELILCSIIFNVICMCILANQNEKLYLREHNLDDKGNLSKKSKKGKNAPFNGTAVFFLAIAAIVILYFLVFMFRYDYPEFLKLAALGFDALVVFLMFKDAKKKKELIEYKDLGIYKPIVALLVTLTVFCYNPAADEYYYISAFASIGISLLSFINIINRINILSTKKLAQLGKRGGDENA